MPQDCFPLPQEFFSTARKTFLSREKNTFGEKKIALSPYAKKCSENYFESENLFLSEKRATNSKALAHLLLGSEFLLLEQFSQPNFFSVYITKMFSAHAKTFLLTRTTRER